MREISGSFIQPAKKALTCKPYKNLTMSDTWFRYTPDGECQSNIRIFLPIHHGCVWHTAVYDLDIAVQHRLCSRLKKRSPQRYFCLNLNLPYTWQATSLVNWYLLLCRRIKFIVRPLKRFREISFLSIWCISIWSRDLIRLSVCYTIKQKTLYMCIEYRHIQRIICIIEKRLDNPCWVTSWNRCLHNWTNGYWDK